MPETLTLHGTAEFSDVARPIVLHHLREHVVRELSEFRTRRSIRFPEVCDQDRDVLLAVTERWDHVRDLVQTVEQVLAEPAHPHLRFEIGVGGGDNARGHTHIDLAAELTIRLVIEGAQKLGLKAQVHVADLIEEKRSVARER